MLRLTVRECSTTTSQLAARIPYPYRIVPRRRARRPRVEAAATGVPAPPSSRTNSCSAGVLGSNNNANCRATVLLLARAYSYTQQYESTCDRRQQRAGSGDSPAAARCWPRGAADRPPGRCSIAVYIERAGHGVSTSRRMSDCSAHLCRLRVSRPLNAVDDKQPSCGVVI